MTQQEMVAWLGGFLAAKGKTTWFPQDFKRVRAVLDEAEKGPSSSTAPPLPLSPSPRVPFADLPTKFDFVEVRHDQHDQHVG